MLPRLPPLRALLFLLLLGLHGTARAGTVPLATGEWDPFISSTMEGNGVFGEIVAAAFREMGETPAFSFYPWKRAESEAEKGAVFAAFPYIATPERERKFVFSDVVLVSRDRLFYLKESFPKGIAYAEFGDLKPYRIGGVLGYWYENPFKDAGLAVEYTASEDQSLVKLYNRRIQIVIANELVVWRIIKQFYPGEADRFAAADKPLTNEGMRLMVSKNYPGAAELTQRFNAALSTLRANGTLAKILAKYDIAQ